MTEFLTEFLMPILGFGIVVILLMILGEWMRRLVNSTFRKR